jgi:hypothetical protein
MVQVKHKADEISELRLPWDVSPPEELGEHESHTSHAPPMLLMEERVWIIRAKAYRENDWHALYPEAPLGNCVTGVGIFAIVDLVWATNRLNCGSRIEGA